MYCVPTIFVFFLSLETIGIMSQMLTMILYLSLQCINTDAYAKGGLSLSRLPLIVPGLLLQATVVYGVRMTDDG